MPKGVYLFGGYGSKTTSEFLPKFEKIWQVGPTIPDNGINGGCGVRISNTEFVLIGGYDSRNLVIKYNTETQEWTTMNNLIIGRYDHACAKINQNIIVSGGRDFNNKILSSTEIIPLISFQPRLAENGNLNIPRTLFGMLAVGGTFPRILALGGLKSIPHLNLNSRIDHKIKTIEVWNEDDEVWTEAPFQMKHGRYDFGYLALPESTICNNN